MNFPQYFGKLITWLLFIPFLPTKAHDIQPYLISGMTFCLVSNHIMPNKSPANITIKDKCVILCNLIITCFYSKLYIDYAINTAIHYI